MKGLNAQSSSDRRTHMHTCVHTCVCTFCGGGQHPYVAHLGIKSHLMKILREGNIPDNLGAAVAAYERDPGEGGIRAHPLVTR